MPDATQTMTGETYPYTQYGKPMPESYNFAKELLLARANEVEGNTVSGAHEPTMYVFIPLDEIFTDLTLRSDIWSAVSILSTLSTCYLRLLFR